MKLVQYQWIDAAFTIVICLVIYAVFWPIINSGINTLIGSGADSTIVLLVKLIPIALIYAMVRNFLNTSGGVTTARA